MSCSTELTSRLQPLNAIPTPTSSGSSQLLARDLTAPRTARFPRSWILEWIPLGSFTPIHARPSLSCATRVKWASRA